MPRKYTINEAGCLNQYADDAERCPAQLKKFGLIKRYRAKQAKKAPQTKRVDATLDVGIRKRFGDTPPRFMLAGPRDPRRYGWKKPAAIRAAILTGGGVAPGLNRVIHAIVKRHCDTYHLNEQRGGIVYGIRDGFRGFSAAPEHVRMTKLTPAETERWIDRGGTMLGSLRGAKEPKEVDKWLKVLRYFELDVLYVIGGNGSQTAAFELYRKIQKTSDGLKTVIAGIPKTMDNDIFWTDRSFGFQSTVDEAAHVIKALRDDALSTRRVCIIELFGAESGFVAASASLASGCVDAVLVPEEFERYGINENELCGYLKRCVAKHDEEEGGGFGVIVAAEGVLLKRGDEKLDVERLKVLIKNEMGRDEDQMLVNQPRHLIRAIPPNPSDHAYCQRLADLAVDNALAGFTGFVVTRWLSRFVLVPLRHVANRAKKIDTEELFWRQVVDSTGQPEFAK